MKIFMLEQQDKLCIDKETWYPQVFAIAESSIQQDLKDYIKSCSGYDWRIVIYDMVGNYEPSRYFDDSEIDNTYIEKHI